MEGNLRPICGERMATSARVEVEPGRGRDILPLHDVDTSGTTVSGRARVLRRAGAASVYAATVARALKADRIGIQREVREAA
jgi:predicted amidophosphoribosyltransferase